MKDSFLNQFYTIDPDTGEYIIEIALKDYDDVFNSWDSSVYNIRDLDSSLKSFLEECSSDIDVRKNIILRFNMQHQVKNNNMENIIEKGIRNYFRYCLYTTNNESYARRKRTATYVLLFSVFAILSFYSQSVIENNIFQQLIFLSLTVGGWVFLWEAFSLLFIQSSDLWKKQKQYKRLLEAPIMFKYKL